MLNLIKEDIVPYIYEGLEAVLAVFTICPAGLKALQSQK